MSVRMEEGSTFIIKLSVSDIETSSNDNITNIGKHGLKSLLSVIQVTSSLRATGRPFDMVGNQSQLKRMSAWNFSFNYLLHHPFGGGLTTYSQYNFAVGDVGLMGIGLRIGIIGMFSIVSILVLIGIEFFLLFRKYHDSLTNKEGFYLISLWLAIFFTTSISDILQSSVISTVIWIFGGVLVNYKSINSKPQIEF